VHMMRDHIDFFREGFDHKVLCDKPPDRMEESICPVCAVSVKPDGAMGTHNDHCIEHKECKRAQAEIVKDKKEEKRKH